MYQNTRRLIAGNIKLLSKKGKNFRSRKRILNLYLTNDERCTGQVNLIRPTGHVMHQQFNIQQLYALHTLYLCVLYLSENKQRLVPLTA